MDFLKNTREIHKENSEVRYMPYKTEFPVSIVPCKTQTHMLLHHKEPTVILIKNKEVTKAIKKHFECMWENQAQL